ncbi:GFA family protein [Caulobacter segnis]|uniref:GFA family protein n=1 Tax=Caulobacter segnis TaxID=88688 RepID=UPI002410AC51|nr:GFA family protein [Caulobacter segnis]MDG2522019.1 GFA family protein [Caulobacter segnis]
MNGMQTFEGGCQCGAVRYKANASLDQLIECNCSRCGKLGSILTFTTPDNFELLKGEDAQTTFHFNRNAIDHMFCATCGIESFARGRTPDGKTMIALNVRCLDGIEAKDLSPALVDGKNF